jgi:hypothetical protein
MDDENFQQSATQQGKSFEEAVQLFLKIGGWTIVDTHVMVDDFEIDIIADSPDGIRWWIECKGSFRGNTPGSKRGDTVKKAVGVAWYLHRLPLDQRCPYMLVTSHLPNPGTNGEKMLNAALSDGLFADITTIGFLRSLTVEEDE